MFKAFVFRLYPSKSQRRRLEAVRETCRHFYNDLLRQRKDAYELHGVSITKTEQLRLVKVEKDTSPYADGIHSHILQNVVADPDKAFQAFFRRVKAGEDPGYPRFKGRNRFAGFGFKEYGNGFKIDGRRLKLSGIGRIAVRWHRALEGTIKTARISCRAGKWFVAFACEVEKPEPLPKTGQEIGVDVGLLRLATLSDGAKVENPRWYRKILRELRVLQRKIARAVLGGKNRRKLVLRLQRMLAKVANARRDFLNKFADELIKRFDRIVLEDLRVAAMARGRFAMSILDAGWSYLVSRLTHKAESAGREVVLVDPSSTSKTCSGCGVLFEHLSLSDRWISCDCGVSLDRDHNAAINILQRGRIRPLGAKPSAGRVCPEAAPLWWGRSGHEPVLEMSVEDDPMRSPQTPSHCPPGSPRHRARVPGWIWAIVALYGLVPSVRADFLTIDFENTPRLPAGPSLFSATAPMQTVDVPNFARVTGGMVLGNPTFLASFPAHGSAPNLYGTVFFNSNFVPAITIDFDPNAVRVTRVTGVVFNGLTIDADFVVEAFNGANNVAAAFLDGVPDNTDPNSFANFTLAAANITRVQVFSENQQTFDYLTDNVGVTFTPVPEPGSLILLGSGMLLAIGCAGRTRGQGMPRAGFDLK